MIDEFVEKAKILSTFKLRFEISHLASNSSYNVLPSPKPCILPSENEDPEFPTIRKAFLRRFKAYHKSKIKP